VRVPVLHRRLSAVSCLLLCALSLGACGSNAEPRERIDAALVDEEPPLEIALCVDGAERVTVSSLARADGRWQEHGAWPLGEDDAASAASLEAIRKVLRARTDGDAAALRFPDGSSRGRLVVEAKAGTRWNRIQWLVMTGAHPDVKVWKIRFVAPDRRETIDVDLPKDRGCGGFGGDLVPALHVIVTCLRKEPEEAAAFTRMHVRAKPIQVLSHRGEVLWEEETEKVTEPELEEPPTDPPSPPPPEESPSPDRATVDLDPNDLATGWWILESQIARRITGAEIVVGEIRAPPPTGGSVPYGHVFGVMATFRRLGVRPIQFEGAASPKAPPSTNAPDR
jgi:hypothetical protein